MKMETTILVSNHLDLVYPKLPSPYIEVCNVHGTQKPQGFENYDSDYKDNISHKNKSYCELSPLYSFWKQGLITDIFGLAHYRRLFCLDSDFNGNELTKLPFSKRFDFAVQQAHHLEKYSNKMVVGTTYLNGYSILGQLSLIHPSLVSLFSRACDHFVSLYPQLGSPVDFFNTNGHLYSCNMFIAPKELVQQWSAITFNLLGSLEPYVPVDLDSYNSRWAGFFSERFFTYFVHTLHDTVEVAVKTMAFFEG